MHLYLSRLKMNTIDGDSVLARDLELMRERYLKLADVHGQLQVQNSLLEERILSIVETFASEKSQCEQELIDAKQQIEQLQDTVQELESDKQRYKEDCNLAVRLLHRNPNEFMSTTEVTNQEAAKNTQHSMMMPTFPPTFITSLAMMQSNSNVPSVTQSPTSNTLATANEKLRLAESLFKSTSVHRYPSTNFVCSNCNRTLKCADVSIQTSLDESVSRGSTSRLRVVSLTSSDDGTGGDAGWLSLDPHHAPMTVQEYQLGQTRRPSHDPGFSSFSIPGMHHV